MTTLKIDSEFSNLIPPLTSEEFQQLEENLLVEGCRDALIVWQGIIIDGHNRYRICQKHNIPFNTIEKDYLKSRDEVKEWIIRNQFGRRNLSAYDRSSLALQLESMIREKAKKNQQNAGGAVPQKSAEAVETRKELAKIAGVSHDTIDKAKVIEREASPEQKARLSNKEAKINTIYRELRPIKENPIKEPDKLENEKREAILQTEDSKPKKSLFKIEELQEFVRDFLINSNPFLFMSNEIHELNENEKRKVLKIVESVEEWVSDFKKIIDGGEMINCFPGGEYVNHRINPSIQP